MNIIELCIVVLYLNIYYLFNLGPDINLIVGGVFRVKSELFDLLIENLHNKYWYFSPKELRLQRGNPIFVQSSTYESLKGVGKVRLDKRSLFQHAGLTFMFFL